MGATLSESLAVVAERLPAPLVPAHALARARRVAARLPAPLSSWLYLERPLACDAGGAPVDVIANVDGRGGEVLAGRHRAAMLDDAVRGHPVWARIETFARTWCDPASALHRDVSELWLEFDVAAHGTHTLPVPSVFVDFTSDVYRSAERRRAAAIGALRALDDGWQASDDAAVSCIEALPDDALLLYVGRMLARPGHGIRLCAMGLDCGALVRYVARIGWPGDAAEVERMVRDVSRLDGGAHERPAIVHIDVDGAVQGRIGLEYPFARASQAAGAIAETELLDFLVERGLATASECAALGTWPGRSVTTMPHELWPSVVTRRVNHVKLVLDAHGAWSAKAYLCWGHEYRR